MTLKVISRLPIGGSSAYVTVKELCECTDRSTSSFYRDIKKIGLHTVPLIGRKLPAILVHQLWRFSLLPWFEKYADRVRTSATKRLDEIPDESDINSYVSLLSLRKSGLNVLDLQDLVATNFVFGIDCFGRLLIKKDLQKAIVADVKNFYKTKRNQTCI